MNRIFILDDQQMICVLVSRLLRDAGFDTRYGHDGDALFQAMALWAPHLVLLDIQLAAEDGRSIARRLREISTVPILMLSAQADPLSKVQSLELGADDFLTKPFNNTELVARVRALLRRSVLPPHRPETAISHNVQLDHQRRQLRVPGVGELELTEAEVRLLDLLLFNLGKPLGRETLCRAVLRRPWRPGERSLDLHVSNLRNKLKGFAPNLELQSVRGVGYRLLLSD